ncbi:HD-GYP domain-containing protein [Vallitalea sp.]|jgi:HD-GYP domain-containing protein (c-di-GMP phosphodiesterase class II)|uniref:HD-GYP domain-containing protein n=1 Tax=Vallitalea sp. TaxID=1882829 RepID=UPI0025D56F7A|nr:HD domain-containing phosphohydrolase [Vallitalea sp.]MCT4688539.1 HD domain-containing protein [Vallitalea sp.]
MEINLNKLLLSLSYTLDFVEMDILGVTSNHSKRVAYIANTIGERLNMNKKERFDLVACCVLHDNGVTEYMLKEAAITNTNKRKLVLENVKEHCIIGEENVTDYPFLTDVTNVIKYHHETYNGKGFFGKEKDEIPLMSQLIFLGDRLDNVFNLNNTDYPKICKINKYVKEQSGKLFSPIIVDTFLEVSKKSSFWLDLNNDFICNAISRTTPNINMTMSWEELEQVTKIFSLVIDNKSAFTLRHSQGLATKTETLGKYYKKDNIEILKLKIAANLHDLGKLAISNDIIDKNGKLDETEFYLIKQHSYFSRISLSSIDEFKDITEWACNHHEKLDGSGYPFGLTGDKLDFNSRLIMCLDIYQALMEERPYRKGLTHEKSMSILRNMVADGLIDGGIVDDIDIVFS